MAFGITSRVAAGESCPRCVAEFAVFIQLQRVRQFELCHLDDVWKETSHFQAVPLYISCYHPINVTMDKMAWIDIVTSSMETFKIE
jgi:hypothetical protein